MKVTFTRSEILNGSGCYKETNGKSEGIIGESTEMTIQEILNLNIPLKDKFWFVRRNCQLTDKEFRLLAIGVASVVLPIYESKYPENKAPRDSIQAAQDYLNGIIDIDTLRLKRRAAAAADAYAAYAAAYAADAAYAAADAAYAAYAAADAADAAADAADAADADAYAKTDYKKLLLDFLIDFVKEK